VICLFQCSRVIQDRNNSSLTCCRTFGPSWAGNLSQECYSEADWVSFFHSVLSVISDYDGDTIGGVSEVESGDDLDSDVDDEDDEDEFLMDDDDNHSWQDCSSSFHFHSDHWLKSTSFAINDMRDLVQQTLVSYFETAPSPEMYRTIRSISSDATTVRRSLLEAAEANALWSSDNFAAALSIFASEDSAETIWKLLSRGAHLLRPCDAPEYQNAVVSLSTKTAFRSRALTMCQDQLLSIAREFRASLVLSFSRLYDSARVVELEALLKQKSVSRTSNIESWVNAVSTPGPSHPHPMAFAAMMMGLPVPVPVAGGELGGVDEINMLDLEKDRDPDLDDLREEFRPQFKERIQGWLGATLAIGKQDKVFRAVFEELLTMMPFLRDSGIVGEMVNRYVALLFFLACSPVPIYNPRSAVPKDIRHPE
jgi:hypothetical protein